MTRTNHKDRILAAAMTTTTANTMGSRDAEYGGHGDHDNGNNSQQRHEVR
jgi:hypothetical protein